MNVKDISEFAIAGFIGGAVGLGGVLQTHLAARGIDAGNLILSCVIAGVATAMYMKFRRRPEA